MEQRWDSVRALGYVKFCPRSFFFNGTTVGRSEIALEYVKFCFRPLSVNGTTVGRSETARSHVQSTQSTDRARTEHGQSIHLCIMRKKKKKVQRTSFFCALCRFKGVCSVRALSVLCVLCVLCTCERCVPPLFHSRKVAESRI